MSSFGMFLISVVIFMILGVSILLIYAATPTRPNAAPPTTNYGSGTSTTATTTSRPLIPDCFSPTTVSANMLYQILVRNKLEIKYGQLATAYSLILCANDNCERIPDLLSNAILAGGSPNSAEARNMVSFYTKVESNNNSKKLRFLVACMDLIKNNMALLVNDATMTEQDRSAAKGFNYEFCRKYVNDINLKCPDYL